MVAAGPYASYIEFVKTLPAQPRPEIYGFHDNADITKDLNEVSALLSSLLVAQPATEAVSTAAKGASSDELILGIIADNLGKLPSNFDVEAVQNKFPTTYYESINTVLCQVTSSLTFPELQNLRAAILFDGVKLIVSMCTSTSVDEDAMPRHIFVLYRPSHNV